MLSVKRQRVQASPNIAVQAYAPCTSGGAEWQALLAKDLPAPVLSDIVAVLLTNPASQQLAEAAVARCRMNHGCTLKKQMQQLVAETVKEPDDNFCMKMGRLAGSMTDLEHSVDKAQHWVQQEGYEAAFELIWACTSVASDWEERGSDGGGWDDWDQEADKVMLSTFDYMTISWSTEKLDKQIAKMKGYQESGGAYGSESVFKKSILKLRQVAESKHV